MTKKAGLETLVGKEHTLKSGESIRVNEPPAWDISCVLADAPQVIAKMYDQGTGTSANDQVALFLSVLMDEKTREAVFSLIAAAVDRDISEVKKYPMEDLVHIMADIKDLVDWEDIKKNFFRLIPPHLLTTMAEKMAT